MARTDSSRASFRVSSGRMRLVAESGKVLIEREIPAPQRISPKRWDYAPIARMRAEFVRFAVRNGLEIVKGGGE